MPFKPVYDDSKVSSQLTGKAGMLALKPASAVANISAKMAKKLVPNSVQNKLSAVSQLVKNKAVAFNKKYSGLENKLEGLYVGVGAGIYKAFTSNKAKKIYQLGRYVSKHRLNAVKDLGAMGAGVVYGAAKGKLADMDIRNMARDDLRSGRLDSIAKREAEKATGVRYDNIRDQFKVNMNSKEDLVNKLHSEAGMDIEDAQKLAAKIRHVKGLARFRNIDHRLKQYRYIDANELDKMNINIGDRDKIFEIVNADYD